MQKTIIKISAQSNPVAITMELVRNGQVLDSESFLYYHDLQDQLITNLDRIIRRANIDTSAINSFKTLGGLGKDSTSHKIIEAFVEGLKI